MNFSLIILQFVTGNIKILDLIYVGNLIFLFSMIFIFVIKMKNINPNYLYFLFLLLVAVVIQNLNINGLRSITHLYIFLVGPFITLLFINNENKLNQLIYSINVGCLIIGVISLFQIIQWIESNGFSYVAGTEFFRINGLSTSPTDLVTQLTIGLAFSCTFKGQYIRPIIYVFYILLMFFTMSRSAIVVLGIFLVNELFLEKEYFIKKLLFLLIILLLIISSPLWPLIELRIFDIGDQNINIHRYVVYIDVFNKSIDNIYNLLLGWGFGTYEFNHPIANEIYDNPHNIFLYILYSSGLVGLFLFFLYILYLLKCNYNCWDSVGDQRLKKLLRMIFVLQLSTWAVGMVETNILGIGAGWILGLIFGIPLAINQIYSKRPLK